jgi:hypothetical protein
VDLSIENRQSVRDIADTAQAIKGLADSLTEAQDGEDMLAALLALTVQGSMVRDLAVGLYVGLMEAGEEG